MISLDHRDRGVVRQRHDLGDVDAGAGSAERLTGYTVTPGFWNVFGQPVALGRSFGEAEEKSNERVVVLGDALWRTRFAADPAVVGRDVDLNGERWRVIGVAAATFRYPSNAQLWVPTYLPANTASRGANSLAPIARLAPGVTLAQAREVMRGITDWQAENFPSESAPLTLAIRPQNPPVFEIGTDASAPLLSISLDDLMIDFYVWSTERYVRFMTYQPISRSASTSRSRPARSSLASRRSRPPTPRCSTTRW